MGVLILLALVIAVIGLDLAAWRWGFDSTDRHAAIRPYRWEQQRVWRDS